MSVTVSGNITQAISGSPITFTDTSTGVSGLISRTLVITNANGVVLQTVSMGATLIYNFVVTSDLFLTFTETIIDASGSYVLTITYLSTAFYDTAFTNVIAGVDGCNCGSSELTYAEVSQLYKAAALRYALGGLAPAAQTAINTANIIINGG